MYYEETVLFDAPLAYWKLDEGGGTTYADLSGNSNTATTNNLGGVIYGGTLPFPASALNGTNFDGTFNISVSSSAGMFPALHTIQHYTLEAWVRAFRVGAYNEGVALGPGYPFIALSSLGQFDTPFAGYYFGIGPDKDLISTWHHPYNVLYTPTNNANPITGITKPAPYPKAYLSSEKIQQYHYNIIKHRWAYVVATYDGVKRKIYLNGVLLCEDIPYLKYRQYPVVQAFGGNNLVSLGGGVYNDSTFPNNMFGDLAHVAIYNYALNDEQVAKHYYVSQQDTLPVYTGTLVGSTKGGVVIPVVSPATPTDILSYYSPFLVFPLLQLDNDNSFVDMGPNKNAGYIRQINTPIQQVYPSGYELLNTVPFLKDISTYIEVNHGGKIKGFPTSSTGLTALCAFQLKSGTTDATLFSMGRKKRWALEEPNTFNTMFDVSITSNGKAILVDFNSDYHLFEVITSLNDGAWHLLAIMLDETTPTRSIFLDGITYGPVSKISTQYLYFGTGFQFYNQNLSPLHIEGVDLKIGNGISGSSWTGGIGYFALFDYTLVDDALQTIYANFNVTELLAIPSKAQSIGGAGVRMQTPNVTLFDNYRRLVLEDGPVGYWPLDDGDIAAPGTDLTFLDNFEHLRYPTNSSFTSTSHTSLFLAEPTKNFIYTEPITDGKLFDTNKIITIRQKKHFSTELNAEVGILDNLKPFTVEFWVSTQGFDDFEHCIVSTPFGKIFGGNTNLYYGINYFAGGDGRTDLEAVYIAIVADPVHSLLMLQLDNQYLNFSDGQYINHEAYSKIKALGPLSDTIQIFSYSNNDYPFTHIEVKQHTSVMHLAVYNYALLPGTLLEHYNVGRNTTIPAFRAKATSQSIGGATSEPTITIAGGGGIPSTLLVLPVHTVDTGGAHSSAPSPVIVHALPTQGRSIGGASARIIGTQFAKPINAQSVGKATSRPTILISL